MPSSSSAPASPYDSLLGVFWGTGVGGGLVLDGKRWLGRGAAGEIGHMVVERGGARCPCGRRGLHGGLRRPQRDGGARPAGARRRARRRSCSRSWRSAGATGSRAASGSGPCEHEDELAEQLIERALKALGAGVASAVNLLDVEAVIIGGGLGVRFGEPYVERIAQADAPAPVRRRAPAGDHVAQLGDLGGAIGASLLFDE